MTESQLIVSPSYQKLFDQMEARGFKPYPLHYDKGTKDWILFQLDRLNPSERLRAVCSYMDNYFKHGGRKCNAALKKFVEDRHGEVIFKKDSPALLRQGLCARIERIKANKNKNRKTILGDDVKIDGVEFDKTGRLKSLMEQPPPPELPQELPELNELPELDELSDLPEL